MKISIKSKNATRNTAKTIKIKAGKVKAVVARAAYKGITGRAVLLVSGTKGCAFRLAEIGKDGVAKLVQNNIGLRYDGAKIDLLDTTGKSRDKQTRLELGDYIASKGERVGVKVLTLAQAQSLAKEKHTVERNGHSIKLRTFGDVEKHYVASIEQFKTGTVHYFQWETERLSNNKRHFGAMVS